ncbi:efflux RND transporter periplasmic adaptor subunit [Frigoriglobus tundricola]|uniref:RND efflux system, membrane fusion protein n=1 Tax=Frigoriglobus tundricola TaxID=2774151 RepID=A0A6M5YLF9_9BACT|nr:efflux RND transporter periplasmic adaptor subunit [Frigoriglobus tundricola]QJW94133.1 RND efflux system, membrane fusion protein [Frigoriglobus tundricola]
MKVSKALSVLALALISLSLPACDLHKEEQHHEEHQKIVVTSPEIKDVTVTQPYVCQIRSQRNIDVKALQEGYLEAIAVKEGQVVKQGEVLFQVVPVLYQTRLDAERAKAKVAQIKYDNTKRLNQAANPVVSEQEVKLAEAELAEANAKVKTAEAELEFTTVRAKFDGIIDRLSQQEGSLVKKEEILTTLSDNSVMWVYFNVPEARYLEYKLGHNSSQQVSRLELEDSQIELVLANGSKFPYSPGNTVTIEAKFNNETGNIPFRADFPNPDRLLRHGQTGTLLIHRTLRNAIVIPQRATYEVLDKQYVYVVGEDHVVHQREIVVAYEKDDIFVIKKGLSAHDKIVLEGVRQVRDGEKVEHFEFVKPDEALTNQKYHAE